MKNTTVQKMSSLSDLEHILSGVKMWFSVPYRKSAFFCTLMGGFLCHGYGLTTFLVNHDGLGSWYSDNDVLTSGRWFLTYASDISSQYMIPWVLGLLSIFYIALSAVLVVETLKIERPVLAGLCGLLMVTFPTVVSTFSYIFTADAYFLALLLSVLAVYLSEKIPKWYGILLGGLCVGLSMGIYQAYVSVTLVLLCMIAIIRALDRQEEIRGIGVYILRSGCLCICGGIVYVIGLVTRLKLENKVLSSYQGINQMGTENPLAAAWAAWENGVRFICVELPNWGGRTIPYIKYCIIACCLMVVSLVTYGLIRCKFWKQLWRLATAMIFGMLIPFGMSIARFMSPDSRYGSIMRYSAVLIVIFMLLLINLLFEIPVVYNFIRLLSHILAGVICIALIWGWTLISNVVYVNMERSYEKVYATLSLIAYSIKNLDGYYSEMPVFISAPIKVSDTSVTTGLSSGTTGVGYMATKHDFSFSSQFLNMSFQRASEEEAEKILSYDQFLDMPVWPENGSVTIIDGIAVVKTAETES